MIKGRAFLSEIRGGLSAVVDYRNHQPLAFWVMRALLVPVVRPQFNHLLKGLFADWDRKQGPRMPRLRIPQTSKTLAQRNKNSPRSRRSGAGIRFLSSSLTPLGDFERAQARRRRPVNPAIPMRASTPGVGTSRPFIPRTPVQLVSTEVV